MNKKAKIITFAGLGTCLTVVGVSMTAIMINGIKIKASNEATHSWVLTASDFNDIFESPHEYWVTSPGGATIYICSHGLFRETLESVDIITLNGTDDPSIPSYISNYEELEDSEYPTALISAVRGIKSINIEGSTGVENLKIMVGQDGIHGSCTSDSDSRENLVDISEMKDDIDYNYFYIENKTNTNVVIDSITIEYTCSDEPSCLNIPFVFKANEEWTEYGVRFDIDFLDHPYAGNDLFIPSTYNGLPVTKIYGENDEKLLEKLCFQDLKGSLFVHEDITEFGPYSFAEDCFDDENSGLRISGEPTEWIVDTTPKTKTITLPSDDPNADGKLVASYVSQGYTISKKQ